MKLKVIKYKPNFVDSRTVKCIVELSSDYDIAHAKYKVLQQVPWLYDKYTDPKLTFEFLNFTCTMVLYDGKPYTIIKVIEL